MIFGFLLTKDIPALPETIRVLENYGFITIHTTLIDMPNVGGDHVILEGSPKDVADWLRPLDGFWVQKPGSAVAAQEFEVHHIAAVETEKA